MLYDDVRLKLHSRGFEISVPMPDVRLVSRQMKQEYDRRPHYGHVRITDHSLCRVPTILPPCATRSSRLVVVFELHIAGDFEQYGPALTTALQHLVGQLPHLQSIKLHLSIRTHEGNFSDFSRVQDTSKLALAVPLLSSIEIWAMRSTYLVKVSYDSCLGRWSTQSGWIVDTAGAKLLAQLQSDAERVDEPWFEYEEADEVVTAAQEQLDKARLKLQKAQKQVDAAERALQAAKSARCVEAQMAGVMERDTNIRMQQTLSAALADRQTHGSQLSPDHPWETTLIALGAASSTASPTEPADNDV